MPFTSSNNSIKAAKGIITTAEGNIDKISHSGSPRRVCWNVLLSRKSLVGSERWKQGHMMSGIVEGVENEM